jgi:hypothetical protein
VSAYFHGDNTGDNGKRITVGIGVVNHLHKTNMAFVCLELIERNIESRVVIPAPQSYEHNEYGGCSERMQQNCFTYNTWRGTG